MMQATIYLLLAAALQGSYSEAYPKDVEMALNTYKAYVGHLRKELGNPSDTELAMAFAIVAPEVSRYDVLMDFFEVKGLQRKYVADGSCDYSVGYFQMKPSFVESLEKEVSANKRLYRKYGKRLAYGKGSAREIRALRLERLCDVKWQITYLAVFVDVVRLRTAGWGLKSSAEKVRCWATLYNAGFYLSKQRVGQRQGVKQFPRGTTEFNYSAVAVELYHIFTSR
jgi:hypothetical protein